MCNDIFQNRSFLTIMRNIQAVKVCKLRTIEIHTGLSRETMTRIVIQLLEFSDRYFHALFSSEDSEFIHDVFMKNDSIDLYLEEDCNFKLILHERDFTPGVTIHSNIVDAITHSRRMFTILSRLNLFFNY